MEVRIRKIWNSVTSLLVIITVALATALVGVRLIGLDVYTVLSGSMEPTYETGSLIYVKDVNHQDLAEGDPITYLIDEDTVVTHRIVEIVPDEEDASVIRYKTKGDANNAADGSLVHYKNVLGKPVFTIPKLGYFADYIQHPPGMYVAIAAGAVLILLVFVPDLLDDEEETETTAES
ncbi:signal peptidase I [Marinilactibacillus psychrotolerans]|uniref:Signal peptidase I n=1 Tax=Marinilactibacillus psychrotolerans TaxID=191770 RepID=A0ABW8UMB4_9LACT